MQEVEIKIIVRNDGTATVNHGRLSQLEASLILTQVTVQLQANALQQSGRPVIATAAGMPAGLRLS